MKGIDIKLLEACGATFILNEKVRPSINGVIYKAEMYFNKEFFDATVIRFWFGGGTLTDLKTKSGKDILLQTFDKVEEIITTDIEEDKNVAIKENRQALAEMITKKTILSTLFFLYEIVGTFLLIATLISSSDIKVKTINATIFGTTILISKILELKVRAYDFKGRKVNEKNL